MTTPAPPRPTRSIVRRLMLALTVSIALASVGTVIVLASIETRRRGAELERDADDAVRELARVTEPALWDLDMERAAQLGAAFAEDPRVVRLTIRDNTSGQSRAVRQGAAIDTVARALPVMHDGRLIGTVQLSLSRATLRRAIREQVLGALRVSLIALIVAFLVVRLLVRRLLDQPLDALAADVATYDDGRPSAKPTAASQFVEFETLHEVLGAMRTRIAGQLHELQASNQRLTSEVASHQRTEQALRGRNRELASLNRFLALAATEVPSAFLLRRACDEITTSLGMPYGVVGLFDAGADTLTLVADTTETTAESEVVDLSHLPVTREFVARRTPLVVPDVHADERFAPALAALAMVDLHALAAFPIVVEGEAIGAIIIGTHAPHEFTDSELALAVGITTQASTAMARYRATAAQRLLRAAIEQSPDCVLITDTAGRIVYANEAFTTLTQYGRAEVLGATPRLLRSDVHPPSFFAAMWRALGRGETWRGRITNRRRDGAEFVVDAIIAPVREESGAITNYIAVESDVTQELVREERFRHAQRMDAVGQLAGGIAHDFNNIIGAITMELELLELEHALPGGARQVVADVRASAQRAATLTRQLLMFSRRQVMTMRPHDLTVVVRELLRMLARLLGERVVIDFRPAVAPLIFEGDAGMIEQVIVNLCVNARDAMPLGGTLTVSTTLVRADAADIPATSDAAPGRYVRLEIRDTGAGMSQEILAHLFEPFFTTKDVGKGTGLGLATAHGLVAQHHGWIAVESAVGAGSTFRVFLPALETGTASDATPPAAPVPAAAAATVLLVEDEPPVRRVVARSLQRLGYRVLEATDGVDALRVWDEARGAVDLLLTDMVMPEHLSGIDLAVSLRDRDPALKVVVMSGYDVRLVGDNAGRINEIDFLGKPFSLAALGEVVTRVLGTNGRDAHDAHP